MGLPFSDEHVHRYFFCLGNTERDSENGRGSKRRMEERMEIEEARNLGNERKQGRLEEGENW